MKKIMLWLWLLTKRQLKNVFFLMIVVLVPVLSFVASRVDSLSQETQNRAALYARDDDKIAAGTIEELLTADSSYEFYLCGSEEELIDEVRDGNAQCGFIFDDKLTERIEKGKYKGNLIIVAKKNSILADTIRETVFAAYFKEFAKKTGLDFIASNEKFSQMDPEGLEQFEGAYEQYREGSGTFKVSFETMDGADSFAETQVIETTAVKFPLRGIMAVLIMTGTMMGLLGWLSDREKGVFAPMKHDFIVLSRLFYVLIPTAFLGISTIISLMACGENVSLGHEIMTMAGYVVLLTVIGTFFSFLIRKSSAVISAMPVFIIGSLLICPVLIDLTLYVPVLKWIRYLFVPYYYMNSF